ncbi:MAG: hypothetical protein JWP09_377 [Candidatus Taylorbacteria bacterium]|nr:hypothetical protein [Candidatus Taylorbacteria bacterium]
MNYTYIIIATLAQFVLGALWYSPLMFGKWWMQIMGAENRTKEEMQKMQKEMVPFYLLQIFLTFVFTCALTIMLILMPFNPYTSALVLLIGFIIPTQIGGVIWGNTPKRLLAKQLFVMVSYQFFGIILATFILAY